MDGSVFSQNSVQEHRGLPRSTSGPTARFQ
jgi:hypothetical protein